MTEYREVRRAMQRGRRLARVKRSAGPASVAGVAMAMWFLIGASSALATPGDPVLDFGDSGVVRVDVDPGADNTEDAVAIDAQGRIVVLATSEHLSSTLLRFQPSGAFDPSFGGGDGAVQVPEGPWYDLAIQSHGKIVLAGAVRRDLALARYDQDGSLDPAFGSGGIATARIDPPVELRENEIVQETLENVAIQADGGIVAAGNFEGCRIEEHLEEKCRRVGSVLSRFTSDGHPDAGFGSGGTVALDLSKFRYSRSYGESEKKAGVNVLALEPGGILVGGGTGTGLVLFRFTSTGSLDRTFSGDGVARFRADNVPGFESFDPGEARALVIQPGGRIVVVGEVVLLGLTPRGKADKTFGREGVAPLEIEALRSQESIRPEGAAIDSRGRILVAGPSGSRGRRTAVWRFFPNGAPDPRFAGTGRAELNLAEAELSAGGDLARQKAAAVALRADGSVLAVGYALSTAERRELTMVAFDGGDGKRAYCHGRPAVAQGTPGRDHLRADGPIVAFGGDDVIEGAWGPICAGSGDDEIWDSYSANVYAGSGNDRITARSEGRSHVFGGHGDDEIRPAEAEAEEPDNFNGGPGEDLLDGGAGRDRLVGGPGEDRLLGGAARDALWGGPGSDLLVGGLATDRLVGGPGRDRSFPGPDSPPTAIYAVHVPDLKIRFTVRGHRIATIAYTVREHCGKGWDYITSSRDSHFNLPIKADGRFRYSYESPVAWSEYGSNSKELKGHVGRDAVVGTYSGSGSYTEEMPAGEEVKSDRSFHCSTGQNGDSELRFTARRIGAGG